MSARRSVLVGAACLALAVLFSFLRRDHAPQATARRSPSSPPTPPAALPSLPATAPAPTLVDAAQPPTPTAPRSFRTQMRAHLASIDPAVSACAKRARDSGKTYTGQATLYFIAGRDKARVVSIEATGIVDDDSTELDETTIDDDSLLACLHEAARGMPAIEIHDTHDSVHAHWRVVFAAGEVTRYPAERLFIPQG